MLSWATRGSFFLRRQCNTLCTSGFLDNATFSHTGLHGVWYWHCLRERRAGASRHKFPTYSPGGATVFDVDVAYNGSKLLTGGVSNDDMRGALSLVGACSVRYNKSRGRSLLSMIALFAIWSKSSASICQKDSDSLPPSSRNRSNFQWFFPHTYFNLTKVSQHFVN